MGLLPGRRSTALLHPDRAYRLWVVMVVAVLAAPLLPLAVKITPTNVDHLEVAWTYRTGDVSANENGRAGTADAGQAVFVRHCPLVAEAASDRLI